MSVINRVLSPLNLARMKDDFKFLSKLINPSAGELDIFLREDYFNIYYKGNSLAKVTFRPGDHYDISVNSKFFENSPAAADGRFQFAKTGSMPTSRYHQTRIHKNLLHPLFQSKNLEYFKRRIKEVAYQEELVVEQQIITDNRDNDEVIIVDRQVSDRVLKRRMDLLALCKTPEGEYNFLVLEVKLGNSKDLEGPVIDQMHNYMDHIESCFADYKKCYEENYRQSYELNYRRTDNAPGQVTIVGPVRGRLLVAGYSGLGRAAISRLVNLSAGRRFEVQQFAMRVL